MFEQFTAEARAAVAGAQGEARTLGHDFIGTEHLLIGLLADPDGPVAEALRIDGADADYVRAELTRRVGPRPPDPAFTDADEEDAAALKAIGIDLDAVRKAVESTFGEGALRLPRETAPAKRGLFARISSAGGGYLPFTRRNKKVLGLSLREALRLNQKFIAPEHIMLGMIREGQGLGVLILTEKGVDLGRLREELTRSLRARAA
jgi:ATP-dependent Clp protease ATP-binding subunit ClpA